MAILSRPVPMHPPTPVVELMTDASLFGWSGLLLPRRVEDSWGQEVRAFSMNWKELKAIHLSLLHFSKFLRGKVVKILSDNTSALACIHRQGSLSSVPLSSLTEEILLFCERLGISLIKCCIKGALNVLADKGSRDKPVSKEWSIDLATST